MLEIHIDVLIKSALFDNIETNDLRTMLACLKPKISKFHKNDLIAAAGEKFEKMGIMLSGEAAVIKENIAGNRMIMAILQPGDLFGEAVVFSHKSVWPATIIAQKPCYAMFLAREKILGQCNKACNWHRTIIENMLRLISDKTLMLNKQVEYLSMKSMREKISSFLIEQYEKAGDTTFILPMMRNELADFLNVSRPSMSREMGRMRDEGIIDFHKSSIQIKDIAALKQMAELVRVDVNKRK
ncbi:MAG: Crp/Fnr family transcriptional regulator [Desulfitobacteriaceae bacterium]|nr:Crp/Fnr family transcriptional regulator [Desulfitobacteriaceae bacterium]MDD4345530.1 Crp/Fnr family transcriptional regulator [Desulfitobacteriaceae bacterium]MDD4401661.1 Crp/Fnr family transcriptional regulator [Desulfitobacteriaceae bacterium]